MCDFTVISRRHLSEQLCLHYCVWQRAWTKQNRRPLEVAHKPARARARTHTHTHTHTHTNTHTNTNKQTNKQIHAKIYNVINISYVKIFLTIQFNISIQEKEHFLCQNLFPLFLLEFQSNKMLEEHMIPLYRKWERHLSFTFKLGLPIVTNATWRWS